MKKVNKRVWVRSNYPKYNVDSIKLDKICSRDFCDCRDRVIPCHLLDESTYRKMRAAVRAAKIYYKIGGETNYCNMLAAFEKYEAVK